VTELFARKYSFRQIRASAADQRPSVQPHQIIQFGAASSGHRSKSAADQNGGYVRGHIETADHAVLLLLLALLDARSLIAANEYVLGRLRAAWNMQHLAQLADNQPGVGNDGCQHAVS
jgi:hypothetical protein